MDYENKTIKWKPLSEYNGGRVLATNGLDLLIGEITSDGDCADGDGCLLCGITAFADIDDVIPKPKESEDERIRKELIEHIRDQQSSFISAPDCRDKYEEEENNKYNSWIAWLEKQKERSPLSKDEEYTLAQIIDYLENNDCPTKIEEEVDFIISIAKKVLKSD